MSNFARVPSRFLRQVTILGNFDLKKIPTERFKKRYAEPNCYSINCQEKHNEDLHLRIEHINNCSHCTPSNLLRVHWHCPNHICYWEHRTSWESRFSCYRRQSHNSLVSQGPRSVFDARSRQVDKKFAALVSLGTWEMNELITLTCPLRWMAQFFNRSTLATVP